MWMKTVFSVLLLCMLVGTPMAAEYGAGIDNSGPWMYCDPAVEPKACRSVVKLQCVGSQVPEAVLSNCCQQLAGITNEWCRCHALSTMLRGVYEELGAREGQAATATEVFPGCRKEVLKLTAASVPGVCKVDIPNGYGASGRADVCYWAKYPDA